MLVVPALGSAQSVRPATPAPIDWHISPTRITATCDSLIAATHAAVAKVARIPRDKRTFANALLPVEHAVGDLWSGTVAQFNLYQLSPDSATRSASLVCNQRIVNTSSELGANPEVYATALQVERRGGLTNPADRKLVQFYLEAGRTYGAGLDSVARAKAMRIRQRLDDLTRDYNLAIASDTSTIAITVAEAKGLPEQFIASLKHTVDGGFAVPVNSSTRDLFLTNAQSSAARKRFLFAHDRRGGPENIDRLRLALSLRDSLAHLFGFPNWAVYRLDTKMVKDPATVKAFLSVLDAKLLPKAEAERDTLERIKHEAGEQAPLEAWDVAYYGNILRKSKYAVDDKEVRQYLPMDHVVDAVLEIYQQLLGVRFSEVVPADAWAPLIRQFTVTDAASGRALGTIYLDLFPRPNKFDWFASFPFTPSRRRADGSVELPVSAIIGNWPMPAAGKPSLLSHLDVRIFFHEFGHLMHFTLGASPYFTTSLSFRQDFVEAPSQMLENWIWRPEVLGRISKHVTTGEPMPRALAERLASLEHVEDGTQWTVQAFKAMYDLVLHTSSPEIDPIVTYDTLRSRMMRSPAMQGTLPAASFSHIMNGGYDAGYYGYLWSRVYAQDLFTRFDREGLANAKTGMAYRTMILEPAAAFEPDELVARFLGRPMSSEAFYESVGVKPRRGAVSDSGLPQRD